MRKIYEIEDLIHCFMGRCTENTESISDIWKTDTDTVVGIWNTEKYQLGLRTIKYRKVGSVRHFSTSMD